MTDIVKGIVPIVQRLSSFTLGVILESAAALAVSLRLRTEMEGSTLVRSGFGEQKYFFAPQQAVINHIYALGRNFTLPILGAGR